MASQTTRSRDFGPAYFGPNNGTTEFSQRRQDFISANYLTATYPSCTVTTRVLKVLYSVNKFMVILICDSFLKDDTCDPQTQDFFVLSRDGAEPSEDLKHNMTILAAEACIKPDSLQQLSDDSCPLPEDVLEDVMSGKLQEDYMKVQCKIRYIAVESNFDITKNWYI
ncbi:hypothetical protein C0Q70_17453 [Pomacea canaliculata]|uniref:Uncharacterized protein n=1 Tax=Pomacea canaliculata TaxID=400727 RepID=A0A2T7NKG0_POMCA|nr:hypothetical protein C0Q70_17453 [Pomacea canaliculata]